MPRRIIDSSRLIYDNCMILNKINELEKKEFDNKVFKTYEDRFQLTLFPALVLLVIYLLLSDKRSKLAEKLKLYE